MQEYNLKNFYCDVLSCGLGDFFEVKDGEKILKNLSTSSLEKIAEYVILKNKRAGVSEVFLKMPYPQIASLLLEKHGLKGKEILSAKVVNNLSLSDFVGDRIIVEIEDINAYSEGQLSDISRFCGETDIPVLIEFGQTLEEVGKTVTNFSSSPASVLESFGFLDRKCYLKGLNYIDKDDQLLLLQYKPFLIFSPCEDGKEGKGAINLYNFIFHGHKFGFSSGKCYNVDMLKEGLMARNASNQLMQAPVTSAKEIFFALTAKEIEEEVAERLLEDKIEEEISFSDLKEEVENIAKELKEKLNGN